MKFISTKEELLETIVTNPRHLAQCLGRLARFGGQHPTANVLLHSVDLNYRVQHLSFDARCWALLHDAHEILSGEIPRPWKHHEITAMQTEVDEFLIARLSLQITHDDRSEIAMFDSLCGDEERECMDRGTRMLYPLKATECEEYYARIFTGWDL